MKARIVRVDLPGSGIPGPDGRRLIRVDIYADTEAEALFMNNVSKDMILGDSEGQQEKLRNVLKQEGLLAKDFDLVVVPAPGDLCGNTKYLVDGTRCPGCRACS